MDPGPVARRGASLGQQGVSRSCQGQQGARGWRQGAPGAGGMGQQGATYWVQLAAGGVASAGGVARWSAGGGQAEVRRSPVRGQPARLLGPRHQPPAPPPPRRPTAAACRARVSPHLQGVPANKYNNTFQIWTKLDSNFCQWLCCSSTGFLIPSKPHTGRLE